MHLLQPVTPYDTMVDAPSGGLRGTVASSSKVDLDLSMLYNINVFERTENGT